MAQYRIIEMRFLVEFSILAELKFVAVLALLFDLSLLSRQLKTFRQPHCKPLFDIILYKYKYKNNIHVINTL
jgi:hypothetical protein